MVVEWTKSWLEAQAKKHKLPTLKKSNKLPDIQVQSREEL